MSDYNGLTLTKAQTTEIAKNGWITLDEPTFVGNEFCDHEPSVAVMMVSANDQFCNHVNNDDSIHGADFLIVAYRPIKLEDEEDE